MDQIRDETMSEIDKKIVQLDALKIEIKTKESFKKTVIEKMTREVIGTIEGYLNGLKKPGEIDFKDKAYEGAVPTYAWTGPDANNMNMWPT